MIVENIIRFILGLPFFHDLEIEETVLGYISQFYFYIVSFSRLINIQALIDTFLIAFGFYLVISLIRLIVDLI